jgi:hypothetical protein
MKKLTFDDFSAVAGIPIAGKFPKCTVANEKR